MPAVYKSDLTANLPYFLWKIHTLRRRYFSPYFSQNTYSEESILLRAQTQGLNRSKRDLLNSTGPILCSKQGQRQIHHSGWMRMLRFSHPVGALAPTTEAPKPLWAAYPNVQLFSLQISPNFPPSSI